LPIAKDFFGVVFDSLHSVPLPLLSSSLAPRTEPLSGRLVRVDVPADLPRSADVDGLGEPGELDGLSFESMFRYEPGMLVCVFWVDFVLDVDRELGRALVVTVGLESLDELVDPPGKAIVEGSNDNPFKVLKLSSS
jgi:hypothetical protein